MPNSQMRNENLENQMQKDKFFILFLKKTGVMCKAMEDIIQVFYLMEN